MWRSLYDAYRLFLRLRFHAAAGLAFTFRLHAYRYLEPGSSHIILTSVSVFCLSLYVFWFNSSTDAAEDAVNHAGSALRRLQMMRIASYVCAGIALSGFVLWPSYFPAEALWTYLLTLLLGYWYSTPLRVAGIPWRLKNVPLVKNVAAVVIWILPTVVFPLVAYANRFPPGALLLRFALFSFYFELLADLIDLKGDTEAGVKTLPVVLGTKGSLVVLAGVWLAMGQYFQYSFTTPYAWVWAVTGLMGAGFFLGEMLLQS